MTLRAALCSALAAAALASGCTNPRKAPPAPRPADYLQVRILSDETGFNSRLYKMPGESRNVSLEDSVLLDLEAISSAAIRPEEEPTEFTVRLFLSAPGKEKSRSMLPRYDGRRTGVIVGGRLVGTPLVIEISGEDSVTLIQHLAQQDAWELVSGINQKLQQRQP